MAAENAQDLDALMATWSVTQEVKFSYNRIGVKGLDAVRYNYATRVGQLPHFTFDETGARLSDEAIVLE